LDVEVDVGLRAGDRHPPSSPIRGGGRIMGSIENFQRLLDLHPSPMNARLQAHSRINRKNEPVRPVRSF
jgi:D-mannonate dehydratase